MLKKTDYKYIYICVTNIKLNHIHRSSILLLKKLCLQYTINKEIENKVRDKTHKKS